MNLILGDVEETIYVVDVNDESGSETVRVSIDCKPSYALTGYVPRVIGT